MSKEKIFKYESVQDTETLSQYLLKLAEGIKAGHLEFTRSEDKVELSPKGLLEFSLEAKADGKARRLKLKFGWKEKVHDQDGETEPLLIKAGPRDS